MQTHIIRQLNQLNRDFYAIVGQEFVATRQQAWAGWTELRPYLETLMQRGQPLRVLDLGCGHGRWLQFLQKTWPHVEFEYFGIDSDAGLLTEAKRTFQTTAQTHWQQLDLVEELLNKKLPTSLAEFCPQPDLIVAFGLLHHLPSTELRASFFQNLANLSQPHTQIVVTAWQFLHLPRLTSRAVGAQAIGLTDADLETGDYLLDWQRGQSAVRYCHLTTPEELASYVEAALLQTTATFEADGADHHTNLYWVGQKSHI
jgi:tRNA (uracil-5-)-methyltransferase TRM9